MIDLSQLTEDQIKELQDTSIIPITKELLNHYQDEVDKCWEIAQKLDALNPELVGAFTGTPSLRIERQLYALGILK